VIFTILGWFVTKCEVAGMRVIIIKYKAMVLCQKKVNCPLWVGRDLLPKVEEFKHPGVLFTSEKRLKQEFDRYRSSSNAAVVMNR